MLMPRSRDLLKGSTSGACLAPSLNSKVDLDVDTNSFSVLLLPRGLWRRGLKMWLQSLRLEWVSPRSTTAGTLYLQDRAWGLVPGFGPLML
ncbi:Hypothetical predicted protein, partial [Olea europaea subsp. europaea]